MLGVNCWIRAKKHIFIKQCHNPTRRCKIKVVVFVENKNGVGKDSEEARFNPTFTQKSITLTSYANT